SEPDRGERHGPCGDERAGGRRLRPERQDRSAGRGPPGAELANSAGETAPSFGELVAKFVQVVVEGYGVGSGGIEVRGEPTASLFDTQFHGGAALDDPGREHLTDDGV